MTISQTTTTNRDLGDAFDILGSYRRRLVLARASGADEAVPIGRLATELAAAEAEKPETAVTTSERDRNKIRLHHADIPALAAAGLVRYDPQRRLVSAGELPLEGEEWLEMPVVEALEAWNGR
ncbi:DUF7344 domain-containing protein [Haloarcula salinisoli]|uniref:DUF7344 domain-containing protein n=1 Tax=Haloarcula salinisoli TaxID=2487746 RepID=A0A8J8CB63_9EURY|nr:hypothetical protein [Halomicroarcula salinisoli]MBX0286647.1 hypothetical protein [Halomicroarcula salinisoli]MBX0303958.1 hypothetical protein [Halomicroarcula salinisoli]